MKCSVCGSDRVYWPDYTKPSTVCPDCGAINSVVPEEEDQDGRCTFDEYYADLCRECEVRQKVRQLEESIKELIIAIDNSNHCETCSDELGTSACSECPWHQAKVRAIRLLAKEESE